MDYDYDYQEQNDPIEANDQRYNAKNRTESNKNIKLLNEILVAQNSVRQAEEEPVRKKKQKNDQMFDYTMNSLKIPLTMIVLYVVLHTTPVHNLMIRYLPKGMTKPDNVVVYYGSRGLIFTLLFYLIRYLTR